MTEAAGNLTNFDRTNGSVIVPDHTLPTAPGFFYGSNACPGTTTAFPCTKFITASQTGLGQGLRATYYGNWAPRFGFAYRPFAGNRTVVRGGLGILTQTVLGRFAYELTGVHTSDIRYFTNYLGPGRDPVFTLPQSHAGQFAIDQPGTANFFDGVDLHYKDPRSYQWNLDRKSVV